MYHKSTEIIGYCSPTIFPCNISVKPKKLSIMYGGGKKRKKKKRKKEFTLITQCGSYGNTVWKLREFTLTLFRQKFREINGFTNKITK